MAPKHGHFVCTAVLVGKWVASSRGWGQKVAEGVWCVGPRKVGTTLVVHQLVGVAGA